MSRAAWRASALLSSGRRWKRPRSAVKLPFEGHVALSHQTYYRQFHELAMEQTDIDGELKGLSRSKANLE
jgi:hypothetical protein